MTSKEVWEVLSSIPAGTIAAWITVFVAIIGSISAVTVQLYKFFLRYKQLKDEDKRQKDLLQKHDDTIKRIDETLAEFRKSLSEQRNINLKQIRHTIVHTCDEALCAGEITAGKLRSLEEMYEEYTDVFNGNGYAKGLVMRVRKLPVVGKLDD